MGYLSDLFQEGRVKEFNAYRKKHPDSDLIDLSGMEVVGKDLSGINLCNVVLFEAHLANCDFSEADFSGAELRGAFFGACNLTNVQFANASCQRARFIGCAMKGASFLVLSAEEAVFIGRDENFLPARQYLERSEFERAYINPDVMLIMPIAESGVETKHQNAPSTRTIQ